VTEKMFDDDTIMLRLKLRIKKKKKFQNFSFQVLLGIFTQQKH